MAERENKWWYGAFDTVAISLFIYISAAMLYISILEYTYFGATTPFYGYIATSICYGLLSYDSYYRGILEERDIS